MKYVRFLLYLLRHKLYVFYYCAKFGIPKRGFLHDYTKLFPSEAIFYANATFSKNRDINYGLKNGFMDIDYKKDDKFYLAVAKHKRSNKHHWEFWCILDKNSEMKILEMDKDSILEMIADWISANKIHKDFYNSLEWYTTNKDKILLHPKTRRKVEFLLKRIYNGSIS